MCKSSYPELLPCRSCARVRLRVSACKLHHHLSNGSNVTFWAWFPLQGYRLFLERSAAETTIPNTPSRGDKVKHLNYSTKFTSKIFLEVTVLFNVSDVAGFLWAVFSLKCTIILQAMRPSTLQGKKTFCVSIRGSVIMPSRNFLYVPPFFIKEKVFGTMTQNTKAPSWV